jgi:hypothetical protein
MSYWNEEVEILIKERIEIRGEMDFYLTEIILYSAIEI